MKIVLKITLLSFLLSWGNLASSSSIEADFRKTVQYLTKCAVPIMNHVSSLPPDLIILLLGDQFIPKNFQPKTQKQRKLKNILGSQRMLIADAHKDQVINLIDNKSGSICERKMPTYSNRFVKDIMKKSEMERAALISKVKNDQATYKEISDILASEQETMEELLIYWMQKEPEAMVKVEKIFEQNGQLGSDLVNASAKLVKVLESEFGIK